MNFLLITAVVVPAASKAWRDKAVWISPHLYISPLTPEKGSCCLLIIIKTQNSCLAWHLSSVFLLKQLTKHELARIFCKKIYVSQVNRHIKQSFKVKGTVTNGNSSPDKDSRRYCHAWPWIPESAFLGPCFTTSGVGQMLAGAESEERGA